MTDPELPAVDGSARPHPPSSPSKRVAVQAVTGVVTIGETAAPHAALWLTVYDGEDMTSSVLTADHARAVRDGIDTLLREHRDGDLSATEYVEPDVERVHVTIVDGELIDAHMHDDQAGDGPASPLVAAIIADRDGAELQAKTWKIDTAAHRVLVTVAGPGWLRGT